MKIKITIPLPGTIIDMLGEDAILEAYCDGDNLVISTVDEDDIDSFICDDDCRNCPIADECEDFIPCPEDVDCDECPYYCTHSNRCVYDDEN